jgi:Holliday junction DNA helicase RuvA
MIASLRGALLESGPDGVVIEAGGVGYAVTITAAAQRSLPPLGAAAFLLIHTHAVQDGPLQLFGFAEAEERRLFETLLSVQGVGPRVAMAILSSLPTGELVRAIGTSDIATLTKIRGVGRKIAERISVELRDKIGLPGAEGGSGGAVLPGTVPPGRIGEVHGALTALGYKPSEFDAILAKLDEKRHVTDLIKQALAALRRK